MAKNIIGIAGATRTNEADADYPQGSFRNASAPSGGDGTPLVAGYLNQYDAFFQRLMTEAALPYNDTVDTATNSQFYTAASQVFGGGWTLYEQVSPVSVTSFQVTGIPSTATTIMIVWSDIGVTGLDNGNNKNFVRVMDDSVVQTTGYEYEGIRYQNAATPIQKTASTFLSMNHVGAGLADSNQFGVAYLVKNPTTGHWQFTSNGYAIGTAYEPLWGMGNTPVIAGDMDGLEFSNENGYTYDNGTVCVYYAES